MTLAYLGGGRVWDLALRYHIAASTFYVILWRTIAAINNNVPFEGIPLNDQEKMEQISRGFNNISLGVFDGCGGAVDGVAIRT